MVGSSNYALYAKSVMLVCCLKCLAPQKLIWSHFLPQLQHLLKNAVAETQRRENVFFRPELYIILFVVCSDKVFDTDKYSTSKPNFHLKEALLD